MAKRYYDLAAETNSDALVPVNLALLKLNLLYYQDTYHEVLPSLGRTCTDALIH